jgi:hypothetical protein
MKRNIAIVIFLIINCIAWAQNKSSDCISNRYYSVIWGSNNSQQNRVVIASDIDSNWVKWKERGYSFGFNPAQTPMYSTVDGILITPYMIQVRGNLDERNKKRWGYHVFEGYAKDDKSRITMLVNKHIELDKPVAELYYYGTEYNHSEKAYNWFKIGSDVKQHSFLFGRDNAVFYGALKLTNVLTLGNIGKDDIIDAKPQGDDETNYEQDSKYVNFKELKNAGNGSIFYDKDNKIVVIKIEGKWMKLIVEPLPDSIKYKFN